MITRDYLLGALLMAAMGGLLVAGLSFALQYFVALKERPSARAAWTAGVAYLVASVFFIFGAGVGDYEWAGPLLTIPGGVSAFYFWRSDFRRSWIDGPQDLETGDTIANDDWRIGLWLVGAVIVTLLLRSLFRTS